MRILSFYLFFFLIVWTVRADVVAFLFQNHLFCSIPKIIQRRKKKDKNGTPTLYTPSGTYDNVYEMGMTMAQRFQID